MKNIITKQVRCELCSNIKKHEKYYTTCDWCNKKFKDNEYNFQWNVVNGKQDYMTPEPEFDTLECAVKWLKEKYPAYKKKHAIKETFYTLQYLRHKDMVKLMELFK